MSAPAEPLPRLAVELGYPAGAPERLLQALTHPSYAHEHPPAASNETLAFLGDAVLSLVVAHRLVIQAPAAGPGVLTSRRAEAVSDRHLADAARALGLGECLRLGRGEERRGGRAKDSVLATALEAIIGALYLDGGLGLVEPLVTRLLDGAAARAEATGSPLTAGPAVPGADRGADP